MKSWFVLGAFLVVCTTIMAGRQTQEGAAEESQKMLVHGVYFTLKDKSEAATKEFLDLCNRYLSGHEGTVYFGVGERAEEFDREVNDQDFDIGLYLVFESKAAHDKYQDHPRHVEFIEKGRGQWSDVRVFDSYVAASLR